MLPCPVMGNPIRDQSPTLRTNSEASDEGILVLNAWNGPESAIIGPFLRSGTPTPTSRGLRPVSRGLVDTCVEGCISLIRLIQAEKTEFCRGCRYFFLNCSKERVKIEAKKVKKAYRDNNRDKYLHPLHAERLFRGTI